MQDCHGYKEHTSKNHSFDTLSGNKAGKNPVCQIPYMCQVSDRFFREHCVHCFFYLLQELFFLQKDVAGEYKANGYIHCSSQKSHGDGHCGGNNVIDSVLQYAEYRIDYFSRLNVKRLRPFHNFRIVSEYIVDPFLENRTIFFYLFCYVYECCPQFRYYYQHNDHDYTDHKADRKHQADRPCQFLYCFFLLFQGFSEQMMFYEFHWNIEDKSDSKANDERKEKAKQNSDSTDDYVQVLDTQI